MYFAARLLVDLELTRPTVGRPINRLGEYLLVMGSQYRVIAITFPPLSGCYVRATKNIERVFENVINVRRGSVSIFPT
jgi:hypothetical protein